jgi:predicted nucleic acid-binding protein
LVDREEERCISVLTYMELLQGAMEKRQHEHILDFLSEYSFRILPLSENIGIGQPFILRNILCLTDYGPAMPS